MVFKLVLLSLVLSSPRSRDCQIWKVEVEWNYDGSIIGLFHLISTHPLWMIDNEGEGGICPNFYLHQGGWYGLLVIKS